MLLHCLEFWETELGSWFMHKPFDAPTATNMLCLIKCEWTILNDRKRQETVVPYCEVVA